MLVTAIPLLKRMSLFLLATVFVGLAFSFIDPALIAHAQDLDEVATAAGFEDADLPTVIGRLISVFLGLLGIILLIIIIYAGFLWMTAGGKSEQVDKAKQWMINALAGLVIIVAAFAITNFIVNALTGGGVFGGSSGTSDSDASVSVERLSGSLGSGGIRDHYPERGDTDIARNTKIMITFKEAMTIESFIDGYDDNGTPEDTSDDTEATDLNTDNVLIYQTENGEGEALTGSEVAVTFTDDLQTFVFDPPNLGSSTEDVQYTVYISDAVQDVDGDTILNSGGYEWSFTVGTEIDLDPPTVQSVVPVADGEYDRNIAVEITFDEAVDPTSASGTRESDSGFDNIQTAGADEVPIAGNYVVSNGYKTITFTSTDACGTNSCGETIYCLPADDSITVTARAATPGDEPPQTSGYPYDGIVDMAGNALDGDDDWGETDGESGDDYVWSFTTTNDINLDPPEVGAITPDILAEELDLDQDVIITWTDIMLTSSLTSDNLSMTSSPEHEMSYVPRSVSMTSDGLEVTSSEMTPSYTETELQHGVFLESTDSVTYLYGVAIDEGVKNQYQNCFVPGEGPGVSGGSCGTTASEPYCCNGEAQSDACSFFD